MNNNKMPVKHLRFSMLNIAIMELSCGVLALFRTIEILTYEFRRGSAPADMLLLPASIACSLYLFLGIIVAARTGASKIIHLIVIPIICIVIIATAIFPGVSGISNYLIFALYLSAGGISIFYHMVKVKDLKPE